MKIENGKFVAVNYQLFAGNGESKQLMEETSENNPFTFIFGIDSMLPTFEEKLIGLNTGDKFDFEIAAVDAYGEYDAEHIIELPKDIFEVEGEFDEEMIFAGNVVPMMDSNGNQLNGTVKEVKEDIVIMDFNHPGAGKDLHFIGSIELVREATPEELTPAACSGGCNCGDGCGESCGGGCSC